MKKMKQNDIIIFKTDDEKIKISSVWNSLLYKYKKYHIVDDKNGEMVVTITDDQGYEIEVTSSIKDINQAYRYKQKYQGVIQEEVEFKWISEGLTKRIEMSFSGRATKGEYQISLDQQMMRIQYRIDNQVTEEGELDVEIIESEQGNFYGITVRVNGQPPFAYGNVERPRGNPRNPRK